MSTEWNKFPLTAPAKLFSNKFCGECLFRLLLFWPKHEFGNGGWVVEVFLELHEIQYQYGEIWY